MTCLWESEMSKNWQDLIRGLEQGSVRSLARMITAVENREPGWMEAMKSICPKTGRARVVGITGSPGSGKSTLTNKITSRLVESGYQVGIIAVDPSSPFSGGALLGDRLRMKDVSLLDGVFVRSMATRGALGGLNQATRDVVKIMDAFGKDFVLIETVGVGQDEVEVVRAADLVMVICVPGQGDAIQAIKAGVMEIADIFIVNKADREGAEQVFADINAMLDLSCHEDVSKRPPVLKTVATTGTGVSKLVTTLLDCLETHAGNNDWQERKARDELIALLEREVSSLLRKKWAQNGGFERAVKEVLLRKKDPYSIVEEIIAPLASLLV